MQRKQKSWTREVRVEVDISDEKNDRPEQVETFRYLGSTISENGGCESEVRHRLGAGWGSGEKCQEYYATRRCSIWSKQPYIIIQPSDSYIVLVKY